MRVRIDGTPDEVETGIDALHLILGVRRRTRQLPLRWRRGRVRVYATVLTERVASEPTPTGGSSTPA